MTSTFLLPFAIGACATAGHMEDAFGIVAIVAMTPLVVVQLLGLVYGHKMKTVAEQALPGIRPEELGDITLFDEVPSNG
ncbi:MAG: DUF1538 family protein, partial [Treponema sp.]|jgi:hypothetical protein|nr:DUF1538 family protein [Treponema sp.]